MDDDQVLLARVSKLEAEAARLREKEAKARSKAEKLERKILRIKGVEPPPEATTDLDSAARMAGVSTGTVTGIAAVRAVFAGAPERVWSAAEVNGAIEARGWASPTAKHRLACIEASISRLVRGGEIVRVRRGRYRAPTQLSEGRVP